MSGNNYGDTYEIPEEAETHARSLSESGSPFYLTPNTKDSKSKPNAFKLKSGAMTSRPIDNIGKPDEKNCDNMQQVDEIYDDTVSPGNEVIYKAGEYQPSWLKILFNLAIKRYIRKEITSVSIGNEVSTS